MALRPRKKARRQGKFSRCRRCGGRVRRDIARCKKCDQAQG
jgi:hypothetical protein